MVKSFYFKQVKKGQAAIEFLMTYGWMLLVVLIVGALIFSFVDFGNLLPASIDISNPSIQPIVADSTVLTNAAGTQADIFIAFRYQGANPMEINLSGHRITYNFGDSECNTVTRIVNNDLGTGGTTLDTAGDTLRFRQGHAGFLEFSSCGDMSEVDVVEGSIELSFESIQTGVPVRAFGTLRLPKSNN